MRMSALADRSGLPVATIKFYLREGLLPPGVSTSATRAEYDDSHVRRLRLVRALHDVAGLRLDAIRGVLAAVDDESLSWHEAVGSAHMLLGPEGPEPSSSSRDRVAALLARRGWSVGGRHADVLARALDALDGLDQPVSDRLLDLYAGTLATLAEQEVAGIAADDRVLATEQVVVGTVLLEPVLLALRRIAQANVSRTRGLRRG